MSDNRGIAYQEGKTSVYRASGIGSCLTAIVAAKLGHEEARTNFAGKVMTDAAREGTMHEPHIIETLEVEYGWKIWGSQDSCEYQVMPHTIIRGHTDGICQPKGMRKERGLEVKTMSKDRFKKWVRLGDDARSRLMSGEFDTYAWQVSVYMWATGLPFMYVVKNRDSGKLDISEIATPIIDKKQIRAKVMEAQRWALKGEIPPCAAASDSQFFCPFPYLHEDTSGFGMEDDDVTPIESATLALIEGMAAKYKDLAKQVALMKPLDDERKEVGQKIIQAMESGPKTIQAGQFKVTRVANTRSYVNDMDVATELGMTLDAYKAILEKHKTPRDYPYPRITDQGEK